MKTHCITFCTPNISPKIDLMKSVKSVSENFISLSDNVKKEVLLYGDPGVDENILVPHTRQGCHTHFMISEKSCICF